MKEIIKDMINISDIDLAINKGLYLNNGVNDTYYLLYRNYKILLDKYLSIKLSIGSYENKIVNSGLLIYPVKKEDRDIYQSISLLGSEYIYLRNDLSVEKLSSEYISILINLTDEQLNNPDEKLYSLIERTYKYVIDSNPINSENHQINRYGPDNDMFWFNSDELVFGFRYDEYTNYGLSDDEWEDNYFAQTDLINKLIKEMSINFSNILGIKTNFIHYDDYTVRNSIKNNIFML